MSIHLISSVAATRRPIDNGGCPASNSFVLLVDLERAFCSELPVLKVFGNTPLDIQRREFFKGFHKSI